MGNALGSKADLASIQEETSGINIIKSTQVCNILQSIMLKETIDKTEMIRTCPGTSTRYFVIAYINIEKRGSLYSLILEVWQRCKNIQRIDVRSKQDPYERVQVIRILSNDSKTWYLRNFTMLKKNRSLIANNHLFAMIENEGNIRYTKIQQNVQFFYATEAKISTDWKFVALRNEYINELKNVYTIWRLNEDNTLALLEKVIETPNLYQFDAKVETFFKFDHKQRVIKTILRKPNKYNKALPWDFLCILIKSITLDEGDGDEVRRFNINQVVSYVLDKSKKSKLPERKEDNKVWDPPALLKEVEGDQAGEVNLTKGVINDTYSVHHKHNVMYMIIAAKNEGTLKTFLQDYGYRPFFYKNQVEPMMAAFETGHFQTLDVISDYLGKEENQHLLSTFYDHLKFCTVMKTSHPKLQKLMMDNMFLDPASTEDETQQMLSSKIDQFPLGGDDACLLRCFSSTLDKVTKQEILEMLSEGVRKNSQFSQVKILTTKIKFSFNIKHSSCKNILEVAESMQDEDISGDFKYIIKYIWLQNRWNWVFFFLCLEALCLAAFNVFLILFPDQLFALCLSVLFCLVQCVIELMGALKQEEYFNEKENYIDILLYPTMMIVSILVYTGHFDLSLAPLNFLASALILLSGLRGINLLALFDETRYLNAMILTVFIDILGFTGVTVLFITVFVLSGLNMYRQIPDKTFSGINWNGILDSRSQITYYYNVMFGNWEDNEDVDGWNMYRYILYLISSFFLSFIMANLVIAMISKTFDVFEEDKELYDTKAIIKLLLEHSNILSYFEKKWKQEISMEDRRAMRHLCIIKKLQDEEKETEEVINEALEPVKNDVEEMGKKVENLVKKVEEKVSNEDEKLKQLEDLVGQVTHTQNQNTAKIDDINYTLAKVSDGLSDLRGMIQTLKAPVVNNNTRPVVQSTPAGGPPGPHTSNSALLGNKQAEQRIMRMYDRLDLKIRQLERLKLAAPYTGPRRENSEVIDDEQDRPNINISGQSGPTNGELRRLETGAMNTNRQPTGDQGSIEEMRETLPEGDHDGNGFELAHGMTLMHGETLMDDMNNNVHLSDDDSLVEDNEEEQSFGDDHDNLSSDF